EWRPGRRERPGPPSRGHRNRDRGCESCWFRPPLCARRRGAALSCRPCSLYDAKQEADRFFGSRDVESITHAVAVALGLDQVRLLECRQMAGDRWPCDVECGGDLARRKRALLQHRDDPTTRRMAQRLENQI